MSKTLLAVVLFLLMSRQCYCRIFLVPQEIATIQSALNSAGTNDTILVSQGEYLEAVTVPPLGFTIGSNYMLSGDTLDIANCIWRGRASIGDSARCITAIHAGGPLAELRLVGISFIQSATHYADSGGAIYARGFRVDASHCSFDTCSATFGGAVTAVSASVRLSNCMFNACGQFASATIVGVLHGNAILDSCIFMNSVSYQSIEEQPVQFKVITGNLQIRNSKLTNLWNNHYPGGTSIVGVRSPPDSVSIVNCEIWNSRIANLVSYSEQVDFLRVDSNLFADNGLAGRLYSQDAFDSGTVFQAIGNTFERFTPVPGYVLSGPFGLDTSQQNVTILERNLIQEMDSGNVAFCSVYDDHQGYRSIRHNYIFNNSTWSWTWPPGGMVLTIRTGAGEFEQNIFSNNRGYSIFQGPINVLSFARHNYYGHETGPYDSHANPGGLGDSIDWRVVYIPWATDTNFVDAVSEPREPVEVPQSFIGNAYPNPFNSNVTIEFVLLNDQEIALDIFDLTGRHVETVLSGRMNKGVHIRNWQPETQASGIYFAQLVGEKNLNSMVKLLYMK